jgi:ribosomal protein L24
MRAFPEGKVIVDGVNIAEAPEAPARPCSGGIIDKDMPLDVSNVRVSCPEQGDRVGYKFERRHEVRSAQVRTDLRHRDRKPPPACALKHVHDEDPGQLKETSASEHHEVPRLEKIVLNMGVGARPRPSLLEGAVRGPRRSPARSRSSPRPRSRSPASSSARATRSAPRSRCGATACGSSSTG